MTTNETKTKIITVTNLRLCIIIIKFKNLKDIASLNLQIITFVYEILLFI